jgi:LuxR family maltose regulon positive regulatory protein
MDMEACNDTSVWGEFNPHSYARLLERLNEGLSYRLILIIAPTKSGKTELLQQWVRVLSKKNEHQIAWVSLGTADNAPESFLADISSALQLDTGEKENTLSGPENRGPLYLEDSFIELLNSLATKPGEIVLILDNYHLIEAPAVHKAVGLMLDYLPPQAHLVIASQVEPPLQIARLRARRQVIEFELGDKEAGSKS